MKKTPQGEVESSIEQNKNAYQGPEFETLGSKSQIPDSSAPRDDGQPQPTQQSTSKQEETLMKLRKHPLLTQIDVDRHIEQYAFKIEQQLKKLWKEQLKNYSLEIDNLRTKINAKKFGSFATQDYTAEIFKLEDRLDKEFSKINVHIKIMDKTLPIDSFDDVILKAKCTSIEKREDFFALQQCKNLEKIKINIPNITPDDFKKLTDYTSRNKYVTNLDLNFGTIHEMSSQNLQYLTNSLCWLSKVKSTIELVHQEPCDQQDLDLLNDSISKLGRSFDGDKEWNQFTLIIDDFSQASDNSLSKLISGIADIDSLKILDIRLENCVNLTYYSFKMLSDELAKLKYVEDLSLSFEDMPMIQDDALEILFQGLIESNNLKALSLKLKRFHKITDNGVRDLCKSIAQLVNLNNLNLSFVDCPQVTNNGIKYLGKAVPDTLNKYTIDLSACNEISNTGLYLVAGSMHNLFNLTNLTLNFAHCYNITDGGVQLLTTSFDHLKSITDLHLDFTGCAEISNSGISSLANAIGKLRSLNKLELYFSFCIKVGEAGLKSISNIFIELTLLSQLSLFFSGCPEISDNGVISLANGMLQLPRLSDLNLCFSECQKLTDTGVQGITNILGSKKGLTAIRVDFSIIQSITDTSIYGICSGIRALQSLQHISIYMALCPKISDAGLNALFQELDKLKNLEEINLIFNGCDGIKDIGKISLNNLKSLTNLCLQFGKCSNLRDKAIENLVNSFTQLNDLSLELNFRECPTISQNGEQMLNNLIRKSL